MWTWGITLPTTIPFLSPMKPAPTGSGAVSHQRHLHADDGRASCFLACDQEKVRVSRQRVCLSLSELLAPKGRAECARALCPQRGRHRPCWTLLCVLLCRLRLHKPAVLRGVCWPLGPCRDFLTSPGDCLAAALCPRHLHRDPVRIVPGVAVRRKVSTLCSRWSLSTENIVPSFITQTSRNAGAHLQHGLAALGDTGMGRTHGAEPAGTHCLTVCRQDTRDTRGSAGDPAHQSPR